MLLAHEVKLFPSRFCLMLHCVCVCVCVCTCAVVPALNPSTQPPRWLGIISCCDPVTLTASTPTFYVVGASVCFSAKSIHAPAPFPSILSILTPFAKTVRLNQCLTAAVLFWEEDDPKQQTKSSGAFCEVGELWTVISGSLMYAFACTVHIRQV